MKKVLSIIVIAVTSAVLALSAFSCSRTDKYVSHFLTTNDEGTFKILQLTDMHFINASITGDGVKTNLSLRDEWAMTCVRTVIEESQPDLIMVTGDSVFNLDVADFFLHYGNDNEASFKKFADFIDSFNIPWAFIFGNHDEEGSLKTIMKEDKEATKKELSSYLLSDNIKNCLYVDGPDNIDGVGNYIINVENADGSLNNSLVMFDSGSYLGEDQWHYECVHDNQLDWYEKAIKHIRHLYKTKDVKSIVFQHIPFNEYADVLQGFIQELTKQGEDWHDVIKVDGTERTITIADSSVTYTPFTPKNAKPVSRTVEFKNETITYHGGIYNDGEVCASFIGTWMGSEYDGGHEFDRLLEVGSTQAVFCGHDHRNTFSFTYKGIRLTYGMSVDYSANVLLALWDNQEIYDETEQRGGTLITLNADSSISVQQVPFARNLYREALAQENG